MRKKTITDQMLLEATIAYVAEYGLENVTTKKIAASLGISEGSIFNYFQNKAALLNSCLTYIDTQIDDTLKKTTIQGTDLINNIHNMWNTYFMFLVHKKNYAKFSRQFRHSSYFTEEMINGQERSYSFFLQFVNDNTPLFGIHPDIFWTFLIETTVNFAIRVADDEIPNTPEDIDKIYQLLSNGFNSIVTLPEHNSTK